MSQKFENQDYIDMTKTPFSEWRGFTPILLLSLTILIGVVGWFATDKLGSIESGINKTFESIGQMRNDFTSYQITAESRFTKLETDVQIIQKKDGI